MLELRAILGLRVQATPCTSTVKGSAYNQNGDNNEHENPAEVIIPLKAALGAAAKDLSHRIRCSQQLDYRPQFFGYSFQFP